MSLIIALALIIIICVKVSNDKSKEAAYDLRKETEDSAIEGWESRFVDRELEVKLRSCIENEQNYGDILSELALSASDTEYLKAIINDGFPLHLDQGGNLELVTKNRRIASDIMMANRGKITSVGSSFGYRAELKYGNNYTKRSCYEYAELLKRILESRGIHICMLYNSNRDAYVWEGSFGSKEYNKDDLHPFEVSLIKKDTEEIPPIPQAKHTE